MHILIVEDTPDSRLVLKMILTGAGHEVAEAVHGADALARARQRPPELIISDILMPVMDGFKLCYEVKNDPVLARIPFVFYTATYVDPEDERLALNLGASKFIVKPLDPDAFLAAIADVVREVEQAALEVPRGALAEPENLFREYRGALTRKLDHKVRQLEIYRGLFRNSDAAVAILSAQGAIVHVNPAWEDLLGCGNEKCLSLEPADFLDAKAAADVGAALAGGQSFRGYAEARDAQNRALFLDVSTFPVRDESGEASAHVLSLRDVTEQRQADEALKESEVRYRALFENSLDAILLTAPDGAVFSANPAACRLFGRTEEEIRALGRKGLVDARDPRLAALLEERDRAGRASGELSFLRSDGSSFLGEVSSVVFHDKSGALRTSMIIRDVSERKQADEERDKLQARLTQAQKMEAVGRLASGVAHDFNNLLTVINGLAELAASSLSPNDPLLAEMKGILDAGGRAANLTRQLLAFARQQVARPQSLDLNKVVGSMEKMLRRLIGEDIELVWRPGTDVWPVYLDSSHVDQLLANLVLNARDAIPGTGTVTIETTTEVLDEAHCAANVGSAPGEYAVLTVTDTGRGMDRETLARVFEPFFTTKELGRGTGLGLATVYGIVKQAGGSVYAYSEPGQGTTFRIYLPRWTGEHQTPAKSDEPSGPQRGSETVLLVEDEEPILEVGRIILKRYGYHVLAASTPGDALLAAENEPGPIHLVATDVVMPGMNGRELVERLQAARPNLKCLYLSGYTADIITQRGVLPEGVNFLQKPYSLKGLAEKVRTVLNGS